MIENESPTDRFSAEHGLSLLIETDGFRMLYDTGHPPPFCPTSGPWERALTVWMLWPSATAMTPHWQDLSLLLSPYCPVVYYGAFFFDGRYVKKQDGMLDIGADIMPSCFLLRRLGVIVGSAPVARTKIGAIPQRGRRQPGAPSRIGKDHQERLYAPSLFYAT